MSAWSKKLKHIDLPAAVLKESSIQTWKKTGAVQELLKVSSLMITTPEEPPPLVEEVEPAVAPLSPLKQFKVRRGPLLEYDPNQPRLPKGTPTVGDKHAGEWTKDNKHLKDDIWAEGDFIYHMDTGYPLKIINKNGSLYAQDKAGIVYTIGSVWNHYSKVPPENSIYKGMSLTDWPDEKKEPPKEEPTINLDNQSKKISYQEAKKLAKVYPTIQKFEVGDIVVFAPPSDGPKIPLSKEQTYLVLGADNVAGVVELNGGWIIPGGYLFHANDDQKAKMIATWVAEKPLPPIKKFKVTHDRSEIPQVFNIGDKVSFRGKMYFVKYVNPEDHMVQIELAKIRHGKVTGVVTGAIVNVKPDTILPWGVKPNGKVIAVGGDEWNKNTAVRLEYDYAKVKPLLEKIAEQAVGGKTKVKIKKTWDDLDSQMQTDIEEKWKSENYDKELEYQRQNYYEEEALSDAKSKVADDFNDGSETDWADEALTDYIVSRIDDNLPKIPFTAEQLSKSMSISAGKYNDFANENAEVEFDNKELMKPHGFNKDQLALPGFKNKEPYEYLTDEMRKGLSKAILDAFEIEADSKQSDMEPPSYLEQQAQESIDDSWSQMDDDEKYKWAKDNSMIDSDEEEETSEGELDQLPTKFDPLNETSGTDYRRTQALAKIMSVERAAQLLVERGLMNDIDTARAQIKSIDERLWQSWKDSSTTENGMILQVAAADELGGRLHEYDGLKKHESIKEANRKFRDIGGFDGVKAYLRGKWETTQYLLDKAGIQTMKVYRNISWDVPFMGSHTQKTKAFGRQYRKYGQPLDTNLGRTYIRYPNAVVSRNGCQSCTTDAGVANRWAGNIVFRVSAPRTAALSIPAYGINIYTEHECVLAGTAWQAYDVWNKPAPTFEEFPLDTSHMAEKMFTSPDSPYMPKMKTDLSKLLSKKGLYSGKSDAYWKKYGSQGLEDKFKPGNKVKWDYPGNDPDNVYTVVGKNDYGIKLKNSEGTNLQAKPEDLTILSKLDQIDLKKDIDDVIAKVKKKPKFNPGDKISGASGSNFADTEFTVNSVNRNGTMDVTSEYGTPYTGVKPHLFQTSTKVQGKFKVGDKLNYGTVAKYEVVKGPYKTYNNDVGYDIKDSSGEIYKNEVLPSYVTKEEPKSIPKEMSGYKVGDIIKGNLSGNIYKIDKIEDGIANLIVKKTGPHGIQNPGDTNAATPEGLKASYTKVENEYKAGDLVKGGYTGNIYKIDNIGDDVTLSIHKLGTNNNIDKVGNKSYVSVFGLGTSYEKVEND